VLPASVGSTRRSRCGSTHAMPGHMTPTPATRPSDGCVELRFEVLGLLREKVLRADGDWVGQVEIRLSTQDQRWSLGPITQLVPAT
jgi:hypothetical protein